MQKNNSLQESFIQKNKNQLAKGLDLSRVQAKILSTSESDLLQASELIRKGELVAFPTETVYGLGANALDEAAVLKIYEAKNRPLTDPVIVHVTSFEQAKGVLEIAEQEHDLFKFLTNTFWPGPLTVVMKADLTKIPNVITANTGYVGVRYPRTKVSQDLINLSGKPIAAPSANVFSHVSPTSALHVFNDLYDKELAIIDGENSVCGVESTVIKIICRPEGLTVFILRNGSVSSQQIEAALAASEQFSQVLLVKKEVEKSTKIEECAEAPGQLLKHYSPNCETYLLNTQYREGQLTSLEVDLSKTGLLDFGSQLKSISGRFGFYLDLSEEGDFTMAMKNLYNALRLAENSGISSVLLLNIEQIYGRQKLIDPFFETVYDKMYRSSSGKTVTLKALNLN